MKKSYWACVFVVTMLFVSMCPISVAQTDVIRSVMFIQPNSISVIPIEPVVVPETNYSRLLVGAAAVLAIPDGLLLYSDDHFSSSNTEQFIRLINVGRETQADGTIIRRFNLELEVNPSINYPLTIDFTYHCKLKRQLNSSLYDAYTSPTIYLTILGPGSATPAPTQPTPIPTPTPYVTPYVTETPTWTPDSITTSHPTSTPQMSSYDGSNPEELDNPVSAFIGFNGFAIVLIIIIIALVAVILVVVLRGKGKSAGQELPPPPPPPSPNF